MVSHLPLLHFFAVAQIIKLLVAGYAGCRNPEASLWQPGQSTKGPGTWPQASDGAFAGYLAGPQPTLYPIVGG